MYIYIYRERERGREGERERERERGREGETQMQTQCTFRCRSGCEWGLIWQHLPAISRMLLRSVIFLEGASSLRHASTTLSRYDAATAPTRATPTRYCGYSCKDYSLLVIRT